jgi:hypothetical protein
MSVTAQGSDRGLVRIRVIASHELVDGLANVLVAAMETEGFEMLEWSRPVICRAPDEDKSRIYLTGKKRR